MQVEQEFVVAAPVDAVRALLADPDRSTACVPGLTVETFAPGEYGGRLRLRVGSTTVTYRGTATVSPGDAARLDLDGQEARGSGIAKGTLTVSLSGEGESTHVGIEADISVTGRLGSLDPAVLEDAVRRLLARFGECIGAAAVADGETEPATGPEGGLVPEVPAPPSPDTASRPSSPPTTTRSRERSGRCVCKIYQNTWSRPCSPPRTTPSTGIQGSLPPVSPAPCWSTPPRKG